MQGQSAGVEKANTANDCDDKKVCAALLFGLQHRWRLIELYGKKSTLFPRGYCRAE
jgi:hypothetical protein